MVNLAPREGLIERIYWLIRLRWIAVAGVILTVLLAEKVVNIPLKSSVLYTAAAVLGAYNLLFFIWLGRIKKNNPPNLSAAANLIANIQISLDLMALTALIHFSGGIENPFIFYFIFHMIIAGILLSPRASYLQATFAAALFILMAGMEYFSVFKHYHLEGFVSYGLYTNKAYIFGVSFVFISTIYLAVYMASSISVKLRQKERTLREANLLLEEKDRIKSNYVLRVSHDIKEHLAAIQSCLEPVAGGITGELNSTQKDLILRADHRTGKLMFFVKALLEITNIKLNREIEMGYFSLVKTVENALNFVESRARNKGIRISCDIDPAVDMLKGAQIYIEEILVNLLANAVKYTPKDGRITLKAEDKGDQILMRISDTGIGIPKDDLPRVFEEFYRARNAREQERDGTGLGLAIAKEVVERHKGKIWLESEEGRGSTFSLLLPK